MVSVNKFEKMYQKCIKVFIKQIKNQWKKVVVISSIIAILGTIISSSLSIVRESPIFLDEFNKLFRNDEYLYNRLAKIRTNYRIEAIEEILGFKSEIKNAMKSCDEYIFIKDKFILQVLTDKEGDSFGYSIISRKSSFNPRINFNLREANLYLNKSKYKEISETFMNYELNMGYRNNEGYYIDRHSQLGGTTNGYSGGVLTNFNYLENGLGKWHDIVRKMDSESNVFNNIIDDLQFNAFWILEDGYFNHDTCNASIGVGTPDFLVEEFI